MQTSKMVWFPRCWTTRFHWALLPLLTICLAATGFAETIVSLDTRNRVLNTDTGSGLKVYRLSDSVDVRINGVSGQLDQLQPGMQVNFGFVNPQTVNRIQASNGAAGPIGNATGGRHITMNMRVDGEDLIYVRDGKVWIEHKMWSNPTEIHINGHAWKPIWNGRKSDEFTTFIPALAPFNGAVVSVRMTKGRGSATISQQPTNENGQTLIVDINDTPPQSGLYDVSVSWDSSAPR